MNTELKICIALTSLACALAGCVSSPMSQDRASSDGKESSCPNLSGVYSNKALDGANLFQSLTGKYSDARTITIESALNQMAVIENNTKITLKVGQSHYCENGDYVVFGLSRKTMFRWPSFMHSGFRSDFQKFSSGHDGVLSMKTYVQNSVIFGNKDIINGLLEEQKETLWEVY